MTISTNSPGNADAMGALQVVERLTDRQAAQLERLPYPS
jgi:hypothetical protein